MEEAIPATDIDKVNKAAIAVRTAGQRQGLWAAIDTSPFSDVVDEAVTEHS